MEITLVQKLGKRQILFKLAENSQASVKKLKDIEDLKKKIASSYGGEGRLSSMVERALETLKTPEPPVDEHDYDTSVKLESYTKYLEGISKRLLDLSSVLEKLRARISKIEKTRNSLAELKKLAEKLEGAPIAEITKLSNRLEKFISGIDEEDPYRALEESSILLEEAEKLEKQVLRLYRARLNKLLADIDTTILVVKKTLSVAVLQEKVYLENRLRELYRQRSALEGLVEKPQPLDFKSLFEKIGEIRGKAEKFLSERISKTELLVIERLGKAYSSRRKRGVRLDRLIDLLVTSSSLTHSQVLETLYSLSRKGIVEIYVIAKT